MFVQSQGASAPSVFSFDSSNVRVVADGNGELWFCASDVCAVLGYVNPRDAVAKHCREKGVAKRDTLTAGGAQDLVYINEPNLYRLIVKSRKPEAERFEVWVMEEVLPSIRKTGRYEKVSDQLPIGAFVTMHAATQSLAGQRYLITFNDDGTGYSAKAVEPGCCVMTPKEFARALGDPNGLYLDTPTLAGMIVNCARRIESRVRA